ncbi:MAG: EamA family transporter [Firmicutes bacterium]|nr:EamA family transporter [Bacillota bacterium]
MEITASHLWIYLVLLYGLLRGTRDVIKKKAMEKSTMMEVLFFYTMLSFLFVSYEGRTAFSIDYSCFGLILVKSLMVFTAWLCSFSAIRKLPVSFYGVLELSSVLFSTAMGVFFLGENLTLFRAIGTLVVMLGLLLVNMRKQTANPNNEISFKYVTLALASCLFNAISGVLDKVIMQKDMLTTGQLQFWFMLLMTVFYLVFLLASRTKLDLTCLWKNPWIIVMAVLFVIGDRALFHANSIPQSEVTIMTLLKRCSCFVTIIGGALVFREKNILYRLGCGLVIMTGIVIGMQ